MKRLGVRPYLTPNEAAVKIGSWRASTDGAVLSEFVKGWDANAVVTVVNTVSIDVPKVFSDCRLLAGDTLAIGVSWRSSGTGLRGGSVALKFGPDDGASSLDLSFTFPSAKLAADIRIETQLLLTGLGSGPRDLLSPALIGSRLWKDEQTYLLEGRGARFPMEVVSFSNLGWLPSGAAWHLDWNRDAPDAILLAAVRLLINEDHQRVQAAISAVPPDPSFASLIQFDVGRQLIWGMLACEAFLRAPTGFEPGSVGYHVNGLIKRLFPGESVASLRALATERTPYFESLLQQRLQFLF